MIKEDYGRIILRLALAGVYLYFGFSQLFDGVSWVSVVPQWVSELVHLPPAFIVLLNGLFEVVFGILLAFGVMTRRVALALALHLFLIALIGFGLNPTGVRDFGLAFATLSLSLLEP